MSDRELEVGDRVRWGYHTATVTRLPVRDDPGWLVRVERGQASVHVYERVEMELLPPYDQTPVEPKEDLMSVRLYRLERSLTITMTCLMISLILQILLTIHVIFG